VSVTNLFVGFLISKLGHKQVFLWATALALVGSLIALLASGFAWLIVAYTVIGMAVGAQFSSLATIFAHLPEKYHNFGLFHAAFGFGGFLSPLLVGILLESGVDYRLIYLFCIGLIAITLALFLFSKQITNERFQEQSIKAMLGSFRKPMMLLPIAILGLYVAVEMGISNWSGNVNGELFALSEADTSFILSAFWIFLTIARLLTDSLAKRLGSLRFTGILVVLIIGT
jgi:MFS family permease